MNNTITIALVNGTDDDLETNVQAFREAYLSYVAERGIEDEQIATAVDAVFDQYKGASINMPALAGFVLQRLNAQPENFTALEERVLDYVRRNADQSELKDKETKAVIRQAEAPRTRTFSIGKGKGGGVRRWSDVPVKA